jgi:beta-N-acetylhexosaminidase
VSALAQRWLKSLSLHDEIAQLIVVSCYGEAVNVRSRQYRQYAKLIRDEHVGGVIVVGHVQYGSVRNADPYAMAALLNRFQHLAKIPLLVAADFERGASMRVNATTAWPYNMAFAAAHDVNGTRNEGAATAREARTLGVNWLFAPVADVNNNPDNPIINIRSYGENPQDVAAHVQAYIEGAHSDPKNPVLVTVKHFPGHGDTATDSHLGLARLDASAERVNSVELIPFRAAVEKGVDAVMTAHIAVPSLDATGVPATVSQPILTGILREQLKFTGIIVTDAMEMQGLLEMFNTREAAVRALEAGADVLLMPAKVEDAIAGVTAAINSGRLTRKRLDESALRVLSAKVRLGLNRQKPASQDAIAEVIGAPEEEEMAQQIADRAVTLVKDSSDMLPVRNSDTASLLVLAESRSGQQGRHLMEEMKKRAPKMKITLLDASMSKEDMDRVVQTTAGSSSVIVAAYATVNAGRGDVALGGEYPSLMSALLKGSAPVTLAALGNPYLLRKFPDVKAYLTTYSTTSTSETALAKALFGEIAIGGRLPVSIPGLAKYGDGIQLPATNSNPKGL